MTGIGAKKTISYAALLILFLGALPLVSGRVGVYIGPSIKGDVSILESAGVDSGTPDTPSSSLGAASGGEYTFVKIDLSRLPPIDEIYIVSAYLGFGFSGWHGAGEWGYASIAAHYCEDDSWSASTLTWNNKPDFREDWTDTWGFSMFYYGSPSLGFTIEEDVEETLKAGDTVLTEVVTWGSGTGSTSLSGPSIRVTYAKRPVYTVSMDTHSDVPEIKVLDRSYANLKIADRELWWSSEEGLEDFCASPGTYDLAFSGRCKFVRWETSGDISVSNPSERSTQITINSDGNLILECSLDYVIYGQMVDEPDSYQTPIAYNASQIYAARHIPIVPIYLRLVRIYVEKEPMPFDLHILGISEKPTQTPPVDIAAPVKVTPARGGWVELDLTPQQIKVEKDTAFYLSVTWLYDGKPTLGGASVGYEEAYMFKDDKWSTTSDGALIQLIVSRTLEEPVKFTTFTTTTTKITTTPKPPTTTKETTITSRTSPTSKTVPSTTTMTTAPPPTTYETTVTPPKPTYTSETTVTPPPATTKTVAALPDWVYGLIGLVFIIFIVTAIFVALRKVYRKLRRKPEAPAPYYPPPI